MPVTDPTDIIKKELFQEIFSEDFNRFIHENLDDQTLEKTGKIFFPIMNKELLNKGIKMDEVIALIGCHMTCIVVMMSQMIEKNMILPAKIFFDEER